MNSLKDMDVSPLPLCSGWGGWDGQPSVYANSGAEAAVFGDGTNWGFSVPPRGIAVHPGADRAVAIGWESPVSGKVSVRAKVVHAHSSGGLGVTWKIVQTSQTRKSKTLALGAVDCGGSRVVPNTTDADKLAAIEVAKGDSLQLQIGPRQYDGFFGRTLVELIITEMEGDRRVWDLSKDVSADIQEGNPHADSLGNPAVWHFFTPEEESLATPRPTPGPLAGEWTIANADIKLTIGATTSGELCINELSNRTTGWNWIATPSVFPLVDTAIVGNAIRDIHWKFKGGALDQTDGQKLTLQFFSEDLSLELDSIWRLRSEHGPAQHTMRIINQSDQSVTLLEQPSIHLELAGPAAGDPLTMWTFHSDGWTPDKTGVYRDAVVAPFSRQIVTHPDGHFIPYAVFDSGEKQGVYIGIEWSFCRIAAALMEGHKPGEIRARGGEFEHFMINVVPGETFETPPALIGAYTGDVDDAGNNLRKHLSITICPRSSARTTAIPKCSGTRSVPRGRNRAHGIALKQSFTLWWTIWLRSVLRRS